MSPGGGRDWRTAGCAALLAAAIAFPAGLMVGGGGGGSDGRKAAAPGRPSSPSGTARTGRNLYSPRVASDPYVVEQQRKVLRALEEACSRLKRHCAEAGQARLRIEEAEAHR